MNTFIWIQSSCQKSENKARNHAEILKMVHIQIPPGISLISFLNMISQNRFSLWAAVWPQWHVL